MIVLHVLKLYWGKPPVRENVEGAGGGWESHQTAMQVSLLWRREGRKKILDSGAVLRKFCKADRESRAKAAHESYLSQDQA